MNGFPDPAMPHIVVMPIVLPLATAAALLLISESNRRIKAAISVFATGAELFVAVALMRWIDQHQAPAAIGVYLPSNWSVPFGIVLVADRLSALMLVLTATIGFAAARDRGTAGDRGNHQPHCAAGADGERDAGLPGRYAGPDRRAVGDESASFHGPEPFW